MLIEFLRDDREEAAMVNLNEHKAGSLFIFFQGFGVLFRLQQQRFNTPVSNHPLQVELMKFFKPAFLVSVGQQYLGGNHDAWTVYDRSHLSLLIPCLDKEFTIALQGHTNVMKLVKSLGMSPQVGVGWDWCDWFTSIHLG
jgi:hypothetical protein